jgi:hypothetical protein
VTSPNGVIFYRGPSAITGKPIVAVAVGLAKASTNSKTGGMVQTHILTADESPVAAVKSGADVSICGGCMHRPSLAKKLGADPCYVNVGQGPSSVWKAIQRGRYPEVTPQEFAALVAGRMLRLGSYGEPVAVPLAMWQPALAACAGHTGYTHRWRTKSARAWLGTLQASCDSAEDYADATAAGWGTFRVAVPGFDGTPLGSEFRCPAAKESGFTTCAECKACDGTAQVVILSHGPKFRSRKVA